MIQETGLKQRKELKEAIKKKKSLKCWVLQYSVDLNYSDTFKKFQVIALFLLLFLLLYYFFLKSSFYKWSHVWRHLGDCLGKTITWFINSDLRNRNEIRINNTNMRKGIIM